MSVIVLTVIFFAQGWIHAEGTYIPNSPLLHEYCFNISLLLNLKQFFLFSRDSMLPDRPIGAPGFGGRMFVPPAQLILDPSLFSP